MSSLVELDAVSVWPCAHELLRVVLLVLLQLLDQLGLGGPVHERHAAVDPRLEVHALQVTATAPQTGDVSL